MNDIKDINEIQKDLDITRQIGNQLIDFVEQNNSISTFTLESGKTIDIFKIANTSKYAIAWGKFIKDDVFTEHFHPNPIVEYVIIIEGKMRFETKNGIYILGKQEVITLKNEIKHKVIALTDVEFIVTTIPPDKAFPK